MPEEYGLFDPNDYTGENDTEWLVRGLIPSGGFCLVMAQSGTGKSWFLEALAVDVACGDKFLGLDTVGGDVLLIDEDTIPAFDAKKRLRKFLNGRKLKHKLYTRLGEGYRISDGHTNSLRSLMGRPEHKNVKLVILDSLTGVVGGKSNLATTKDASAVVEFAQSVCHDGRAFLIAHHISKNASASVDEMMTCDNADRMVMENTRLVAGCQSIYFMASPTRGDALDELFVRPWSKRTMLVKPFSVRLCDNDDMARFTPMCEYRKDESGSLNRSEKRILSEFVVGQDYTVDGLSENIAGLMHPNTLRTNLAKLEDAEYVALVARAGKGGEHYYRLLSKGDEYVSRHYTPNSPVSLNPKTFTGKERR